MAKREVELIVALAEGRLEDESEARALIEASPRLRAVYQAQLQAVEAAAVLPAAHLTDTERTALRRDVWSSLRLDPEPQAATRGWAFPRLGYAAGAALLVVGVVALASQLGHGGDTGAGTFASDRLTDSGVASQTTSLPTTDQAPAAPLAAGEAGDLFREYAETARFGGPGGSPEAETDRATREMLENCLVKAGLDEHVVFDVIGDGGRRYLVAVPEDGGVGPDTPISFLDEETCQIVHLDE